MDVTTSVQQQAASNDASRLTYSTIFQQDLLGSIPLLNACFKPKYTVDQEIAGCIASIMAAIWSMKHGMEHFKKEVGLEVSYAQAFYMTMFMVACMSVAKMSVNVAYRAKPLLHCYCLTKPIALPQVINDPEALTNQEQEENSSEVELVPLKEDLKLKNGSIQ